MITKNTKETLAIFKKQVASYIKELDKLRVSFEAGVTQAEYDLQKLGLKALIDMTSASIDTLEKHLNVTMDAVELTKHIMVD